MGQRVLVAGLFHETNTFLRGTTSLKDCEVRQGAEMLAATGDASPLGGALEVARAKGWEIMPTLDVRATPSATVADSVVEFFWERFAEAAARALASGLDGVYLVLHGAMVSQSLPDVEGEILRRIRSLDGFADLPLCGVVDLHANFTEAMARYSNGLVAYRTNPHTDAREAAMDAAHLLDRLLQTGERPVTVWEHPPLVWSPTGTGTGTDPMRSLEAAARAIEAANPDIFAVNVLAGFSFADTPDIGVSFTAVTRADPEEARRELRSLSALALAQKELGCKSGEPLDAVMRRLSQHTEGPVLLVEPADNIGGGTPGDNTTILRALVDYRVQNAGGILNDPEAVQQLAVLAPGERLRLPIGGKSGEVGSEPLLLDVELLSTSDGRFTLEDRQSHLASLFGEHIDMGPCAVVRHEGIRILLTSRKTPPFDLGQWRSQGIQPEELFVIGVKAAVAHRRAYDPIAKASYTVDTPGPCTENLRRLPFRNVRRPLYPLDDV